jgi:hypothetical protein
MADRQELKGPIAFNPIERREFLRWRTFLSSGLFLNFKNKLFKSLVAGKLSESAQSRQSGSLKKSEEKMIRTGCPSHNCGGRCVLPRLCQGWGNHQDRWR